MNLHLLFTLLFFQAQASDDSLKINKYKVVIEPNFAEQSIKGSTEILTSGKAGFISFPHDGLVIESVKVNQKKISFEIEASQLKIDVSKIKKPKSILVAYSGQPKKGLVWGNDYVYSGFDPCTWMICLEDPKIRAAIQIQIKNLKNLKAVANGESIGEGIWSEPRAYSSYLYGFAVGKFEHFTEKLAGFDAHFMGISQRQEDLKKKFKDTETIVRFFEQKSGVPLPLKIYTQVLVPGSEAQEKQGFAILGEKFVDPIISDPTEDWVLVHELAHQWWGNSITCKSWPHFWLNEGLVVFMTAAYKQSRWGQAAYDEEIKLAEKRYQKAVDQNFDVPLTYVGEYPTLGIKRAIVYSKGALFIHALRKELGDELFWKGIAEYTKKFQLQSVESKDFQNVMERVSKRSLQNIFQKWVY